ncbi:MAG: ribonuclease H-like domain-containing protein [Treponema sp.]|jgi:uncharacterized protein YprB with RNaseH-like and TPR domain|nr:ribonuclease H-like domain-containing protein [Treponema sp.]
MAQNLRSRLQRIRETKKEPSATPVSQDAAQEERAAAAGDIPGAPGGFGPEWLPAGFMTLKRTVTREMPADFPFSAAFPGALALVIPDLFQYTPSGKGVLPGDLLFFDLETTGLSGGAGTVAFLAAFGRVVKVPARLEVTQYLLLDYPGEGDFVAAVLGEFRPCDGGKRPPLVVSYNGKTFDSQILKTRCLMNGMKPPEYFHADLLHPARRLWKTCLPDCSQATIETRVLGLDRTGDIPGALAPDIWFSFLKTRETGDLLGICDHNLRDILGLATLFGALSEISKAPAESMERFHFDPEPLALRWRKILLQRSGLFSREEELAAALLLQKAVDRCCPRALRISAIDAEWKLRDFSLALAHTEKALALKELRPAFRDDMIRRRERLLKKTGF